MINFDICEGNDIECPYCDHKVSDSWEMGSGGEDEDTHECGECGKVFHWGRELSVTYKSGKDCALNGDVHNWVKTSSIKLEDCSKCDAYRRVNEQTGSKVE